MSRVDVRPGERQITFTAGEAKVEISRLEQFLSEQLPAREGQLPNFLPLYLTRHVAPVVEHVQLATIFLEAAMNTKTVLVVALLSMTFALSAAAQPSPNPATAPAQADNVTIYNLDQADLSGRSASWWKTLRREHMTALRDGSEADRTRVLSNIIFLANYHHEEIDFNRQTMPIYYVYLLDPTESMRILALAAIHAIGKDATMRNLAVHAEWEPSDRVRRLTQAAVADYYERKSQINDTRKNRDSDAPKVTDYYARKGQK